MKIITMLSKQSEVYIQTDKFQLLIIAKKINAFVKIIFMKSIK